MAIPLPANAARQADPALEFLAWADAHQRDKCRHAADLAPITHHHNLNPSGNAVNQLQAWAVRQVQARSRPGTCTTASWSSFGSTEELLDRRRPDQAS